MNGAQRHSPPQRFVLLIDDIHISHILIRESGDFRNEQRLIAWTYRDAHSDELARSEHAHANGGLGIGKYTASLQGGRAEIELIVDEVYRPLMRITLFAFEPQEHRYFRPL